MLYKNPLSLIKDLELFAKYKSKNISISDFRLRKGYTYGFCAISDPATITFFDILKRDVLNFIKNNPQHKNVINKKIININSKQKYIKYLNRKRKQL
jgi:hypothetical protein